METKILCDYGCGDEAFYTFKNGKRCCSQSTSKCIAMVKKNSDGLIKARKDKGNSFWKNGHPRPMKNKAPWNKGLTKDSDERIKESSVKVSEGLKIAVIEGRVTGKAKTEEAEKIRADKIRQHALKTNLGGYKRRSGRGKKGWYKGLWCDSSWELAFAIYCLENNKSITRNTEKRKYFYDGKEKNYIPDFIVDGEVIEIKGYRTKEWEAKHKYNSDVRVYYEKDLRVIFDYVINKYGKKFVNLYE